MGVLLSKYADHETTPDERKRVEEHLATCPPCKEMLSIFLRNESMLSKALAREEFGEKMVDRVMDEIQGPAEAEPDESTRWERFTEAMRERPWIPTAAAAALFLGLVGIVIAFHSASDRRLRGEVEALRRTVESAGANHQKQQDASSARLKEMHADFMRERLKNAHDIPGNSSAAAFFYHAIVVRARFVNREQFVSYSVERSDDDGKTWKELRSGLSDSEYEDSSVVPGRTYWYRFLGMKRTADKTESVPVRLQAPPRNGLDPEKCFRIQCVEIGPNNDVATFAVTRFVNRTPVTWHFTVLLGQRIGRAEQTPQGLVDFSTGLEFETVEMGDETIKVTFAWPMFDPETREPVFDTAGRQRYELRDQILSIRPNKRAVFRAAGRNAFKVWRDGEVLIPIDAK